MPLEIMELLAYLASIKSPGEYDLEDDIELENFLYDHYNIDIESFTELIDDLLPLCDKGISPLTEIAYQGFGKDNVWLIYRIVK